jgi:hypothetical protein
MPSRNLKSSGPPKGKSSLAPLNMSVPRVPFPTTYGELRSLNLPSIYCRATSTSVSPLAHNSPKSPIQWSFHDRSLLSAILSRFDLWVAKVGAKTPIPPSVATLWDAIFDHIQGAPYLDESWVVHLSSRLFGVVNWRLPTEGRLEPAYCCGHSPSLEGRAQGNRTAYVVKCSEFGLSPNRMSGVPHEFKPSAALNFSLSPFAWAANQIATSNPVSGSTIFAQVRVDDT